MYGIGGPGSAAAQLWYEIAARHGVVCPYGSHHQAEWNHCQPTSLKIILAGNPLRDTVTAEGPRNLESMFVVGNMLIANPTSIAHATRDRSVAGQLVSTAAVRDITAERLESRPVTMVNRPAKPNPRFEPPGGTRTMPPAREKVGAFSDERRSLVITVEKGRSILNGRAATAGHGPLPIAVTIGFGLAGHAHEHDDADRHFARSQSTRHHPRVDLTHLPAPGPGPVHVGGRVAPYRGRAG